MEFPAEPAPPKPRCSGDGDSDDGERGGGDWDDASSQCSARSSKTHLNQLRLTAPGVEAGATFAPCKGCGRKASATVPWVQYDPVFDEGPERALVGKKPRGRVCRLCLTTYKASGWDAAYGPIGNYFKFVASPAGRANHT